MLLFLFKVTWSHFKDAFSETKSAILGLFRAEKSEAWSVNMQCHRKASWWSFLLLTCTWRTHTTHLCSLCSKSRIFVLYYLFIVIYCLFMYFWGDKSSCAMFRGSSMQKCILEKKTCFWFEAAMLECKSTCNVLWQLQSSKRASRGDAAPLFPLVSDVMSWKPTRRCI